MSERVIDEIKAAPIIDPETIRAIGDSIRGLFAPESAIRQLPGTEYDKEDLGWGTRETIVSMGDGNYIEATRTEGTDERLLDPNEKVESLSVTAENDMGRAFLSIAAGRIVAADMLDYQNKEHTSRSNVTPESVGDAQSTFDLILEEMTA